MQKIYIKNMVCNRCIMVVENIFSGHNIKNINLGEVILSNELSDNAFEDIKNKLKSVGFVVIDDKKSLIISNIKNCIIDLVYNNNI